MGSRRKRRADEIAAYLSELEKSSHRGGADTSIFTGRGLFSLEQYYNEQNYISNNINNKT